MGPVALHRGVEVRGLRSVGDGRHGQRSIARRVDGGRLAGRERNRRYLDRSHARACGNCNEQHSASRVRRRRVQEHAERLQGSGAEEADREDGHRLRVQRLCPATSSVASAPGVTGACASASEARSACTWSRRSALGSTAFHADLASMPTYGYVERRVAVRDRQQRRDDGGVRCAL